MIDRQNIFGVTGLVRIAQVFCLAIVAIGMGFAIAHFSLAWRELIIVVLGITGLLAMLVPSEGMLRLGIYVAALGMAFGWRTIAITPNLLIVPSEAIFWVLFLSLILRHVLLRKPLKLYLPNPLLVLVVLTIPSIIVGIGKGNALDNVVDYSKNLIMLVPTFIVVRNLVDSIGVWKRALVAATIVGLYLGLAATLLVFAPDIGLALLGDLGGGFSQAGTFTRVGVPGWGVFASLPMELVWGVTLGLWETATKRSHQMFYALVLTVCTIGVIASGSRGSWLALLAGVVVYAFFHARISSSLARGLLVIAFIGVLAATVSLGDIVVRFESAFNPQLIDSSAFDRYERAQNAINQTLDSPIWGQGFGSVPFVHSDYLQIAVDMGIPALVFFLLGIGSVFARLFQLQRNRLIEEESKTLARSVLIMFAVLAVEFVSGGLVSLPFTISMAWFFWSMADQFIKIQEQNLVRKKTDVEQMHVAFSH
jgi:O-antigen ligase